MEDKKNTLLADDQEQIQEQDSPAVGDGLTPATTYSITSGNNLIGNAIADQQRRNAALEEQYTKAQQAARDAREKGQSVIGALINWNQPTYDKKRERDMRRVAMAQALGNLFSAAAQGVNAFRRKGAGYVSPINTSSPLRHIEEINRMQREYQQRGDQWRQMRLNYDIQNEQAKIAAADALAKQAYDMVAQGDKDLLELIKQGRITLLEYDKMKNNAREKALDRQARAAEGAANRKNRIAAASIRKGSGSNTTQLSDEDALDRYIYDNLYGFGQKEVIKSGVKKSNRNQDLPYRDTTYTSRSSKDLSKTEDQYRTQASKRDQGVMFVRGLTEQGVSLQEAITAGKAVDDLVQRGYSREDAEQIILDDIQ